MRKLLSMAMFFLSLSSYAQYFNDGQDRAEMKWKKISTVHFEIIFPEGFETTANKVANLMETSYEYTTVSLRQRPKNISIILHTETVKSNAYLGWAPSRIEMYATPHQQMYSQDWLEQLAIHEYRHMVQISKLESEMPKLLRWLFGEQAAAVLAAAYLPFWFIEGDAVSTETGLSNSGRGRFPDFHREFRAQILQKGCYSYDKAYLGSYTDFVANYYNLGYFMVGGARMIYDKPVWEEVMHHVADKPFSLTAFDKGLKKSIGLNKIQLYDTVFNTLKMRWKTEDEDIIPSDYDIISPSHSQYTDYKYGFKDDAGNYIAERSSLWDVNRFVSISESGKEKKLFTPGYHFEKSVSGYKNYLVWSERLSHLRWYHSDRSLIRILNTQTHKLTEYPFNRKIFAPVISPDLNTIATIEVDNLYQSFIDLINMNNGEITQQIKTGENDFLMTPSWSSDGKSIVVVILRNNKKGIAKVDIETGTVKILLPFRTQEINSPLELNEGLYFVGGYSGIDNLYVQKNSNNKLYQVTSSRFGIRDVSFDHNFICYSNYTSDGYQLVKTNLDSLEFKPVNLDTLQVKYPIANAIAHQEKGVIDFNMSDSVDYKSEKYSKVAHLFNFHSWAPLAIDPYSYTIKPGVSFMSQNLLSTSELVGGYRYLRDDKKGEFFAKYKYYGWYPELETEITNGKKNAYYYQVEQYVNNQNVPVRTDTIKKKYSWSETNFMLSASIPFNLSKGRNYRLIQPRIAYKGTQLSAGSDKPEFFPDGFYQTVETGLFFYQIQSSSTQDVWPNFGFVVDLSYITSLPGVVDFGSLTSLYSIVYLPGLAPNHGLKLYNGFQRKKQSDYSFSNRINFPRGHSSVLNNKLYSFASDYSFPIAYPDFNIGRWIYIKRLKMDLSYDFAAYTTPIISDDNILEYKEPMHMQSAGIEFSADVNLLRFIAPFELGVRSNYLFDDSFDFNFIWSVEFTF